MQEGTRAGSTYCYQKAVLALPAYNSPMEQNKSFNMECLKYPILSNEIYVLAYLEINDMGAMYILNFILIKFWNQVMYRWRYLYRYNMWRLTKVM